MGTAAILFAIAAVGGAVMAALRFSGRDRPPLALAVVHGVVAASGLVTLIMTVQRNVVPMMAKAALTGFVIAAIGGAVLFFMYHLRSMALPIPLMLVHATVAVVSFVLLLVVLFAL